MKTLCSHTPLPDKPETSPTVGDIFRAYGPAFRSSNRLHPRQHKVMYDIEHCRRGEFGTHWEICNTCGHLEKGYNPCRNRHCPGCKWFTPDVRQKGRQKTCSPACQNELHRRQCEKWNRKNKAICKNNYLAKKFEEIDEQKTSGSLPSLSYQKQKAPVLPMEIIITEYGIKSATSCGSSNLPECRETVIRGAGCVNRARPDLVCHESKKALLVTVGKMEDGPPATISRSSCQTTVSCVD